MKHGAGSNRPQDYHTQRNNAIDRHGTCNVTAYAMAAKRAGCLWSYADGQQPEDVLARFLSRAESVEHMRGVAPWAFYSNGGLRYKPYEVHAMLAWGYTHLAGECGAVEFRTDWGLTELVCLAAHGAGVVISGDFPHYKLGRIGHIVSIADVEYEGRNNAGAPDEPSAVELSRVRALIVDDPYGDYRTKYDPSVVGYEKGNDVRMERSEVFSVLKNKTRETGYWAHVICAKERRL